MKFYTLQEAEYLIAFYSNTERIECHFELVHKPAGDGGTTLPALNKVGILCVDKTTTPPLIAELDEVVKGLDFTPIDQVLQELRHCG